MAQPGLQHHFNSDQIFYSDVAIVEEARKSRALLAFAMLRHAPKHNVAKFYMTAAMKLHAMGKPLTPGGVMDPIAWIALSLKVLPSCVRRSST